MISKKDLLYKIEFLNNYILALEEEKVDVLRKEVDKLKKSQGCKDCPNKCEKKEVKRGRGRPRKV